MCSLLVLHDAAQLSQRSGLAVDCGRLLEIHLVSRLFNHHPRPRPHLYRYRLLPGHRILPAAWPGIVRLCHSTDELAHDVANLSTQELHSRWRWTLPHSLLRPGRLGRRAQFHDLAGLYQYGPGLRLSGWLLFPARATHLVPPRSVVDPPISHVDLYLIRRHPHLPPRGLRVPGLWPRA